MTMTSARSIPPSAIRSVWVLRLDMGVELAEALVDDGPLAQMLGVDLLDRNQIELIQAEDFAEYGILHYLHDGHGFPMETLLPDEAELAALHGPVLLVFRAALPAGLGQIAPKAPLHLLGRYDEEPVPAPIAMEPSPAPDAEIIPVSRKKPSDAAMSGRVATAVLVFLVLFCVAFVWMAS